VRSGFASLSPSFAAVGVFVTDGVRDLAADANRFDTHDGAYRLTQPVVFPSRQSPSALFGREVGVLPAEETVRDTVMSPQ
jgi:hypothetical protein